VKGSEIEKVKNREVFDFRVLKIPKYLLHLNV